MSGNSRVNNRRLAVFVGFAALGCLAVPNAGAQLIVPMDQTRFVSTVAVASDDFYYESFDDSAVEPDGVYLEGSTLTIEYTPTCLGDLSGNGIRSFADLTQLLNAWGPCPGCPEDFDENGSVGFNDLTILLNGWGPCPEP